MLYICVVVLLLTEVEVSRALMSTSDVNISARLHRSSGIIRQHLRWAPIIPSPCALNRQSGDGKQLTVGLPDAGLTQSLPKFGSHTRRPCAETSALEKAACAV